MDMENVNIDRHIDKSALEIEVSDIIWRMHQQTFKVTAAIIGLQLILCILLVVVQIAFKNIPTGFYNLSLGTVLGLCIPFINVALLAIVVINNNANSKAWKKAKEDCQIVFKVMDSAFNKNYTIKDQYEVINSLSDYRRERLACKKQDIEMQKEKSLK